MRQKKKVEGNQITEGVIWKQLLLFFFPIVFGTFFQQIYNTADTLVVGRFVGKEALAAVGGSASQIVNLLVGFFVGLSSGASVIISQFYGAKDEKNLKLALHTSLAFSVAAGLVIGVGGFIFSKALLVLMKTPADVLADSELYLHIYFLGMVFNLVYNMGSGILRAVGDSKRPLYVLIATCLVNIVLDVIFVVFFHMGIAGVAVATILSQGISAALVMWMLMGTTEIYKVQLRKLRIHGRLLMSVLRIGVPAGMESVMYSVSNLVIQVYVNRLGTDTVAAWGTEGKIDALFWMVISSFGIAITTFVGQNYGAGKIRRMRKSVKVCMGMSMLAALLTCLILLVFGQWLYRLFTPDETVVSIGVHMLHFLIPAYPVYVVIGILSGALRGAGNVLVPMILSCGGICAFRLVWLFLMMPRVPGIDTIMWSYPISWGITAVLFVIYYFRKFPKSREDMIQVTE